jgi:hypothetical protein
MKSSEQWLQNVQIRLAATKVLASQLDKTIADKEAKQYFLGPAVTWLGDIERNLMPQKQLQAAGLMLAIIENQLESAQRMVLKYGPNIHIVGD